jgi:copper(I)-binding protein
MRRAAAVAAIGFVLTACGGTTTSSPPSSASAGPPSDIHVFAATVTPDGEQADVEIAIHNAATTADALTGVSCACATAAEIHGAGPQGDIGPVESVKLPPDKVVTFAPGGPHIELIGLSQPLAPGDTVTLELTFANAPPTSTVAEVRAAATPSAA